MSSNHFFTFKNDSCKKTSFSLNSHYRRPLLSTYTYIFKALINSFNFHDKLENAQSINIIGLPSPYIK